MLLHHREARVTPAPQRDHRGVRERPAPPCADRRVISDLVVLAGPEQAALIARIRNAGNGPALYVRAQLEPGRTSPDRWSRGAVGSGDSVKLTFSRTEELDSSAQLLIDYRDLAERPHGVSITCAEENGRFVAYDVRTWENHSVTLLEDAVYPQPGLRDVSPRPKRRFRAKWSAAISAFRS